MPMRYEYLATSVDLSVESAGRAPVATGSLLAQDTHARRLPRQPQPVRLAGAAVGGTHSLQLASAYGELLAFEEVPAAEFAAALRRFNDQAVLRANSVVVVDGITHSRNSFLEFVREFNDCAARAARLASH